MDATKARKANSFILQTVRIWTKKTPAAQEKRGSYRGKSPLERDERGVF